MNWKIVYLIVVGLSAKLSYAEPELADEDIEETTELVVNYLGPLLELNGFTLEDLPDDLTFLTAKYYLAFSRGVEPLDNLEKMLSDYDIIQKSHHKVAENFQEHIDHFVKINASNNKKAMKKLLTKVLDSFQFDLQIVNPRDAITFLLYQEAYPDIMKILSLMVQKHYNAYLEVRANEQPPSDTDDPLQPTNDKDFAAMVRELVASHGRLGLLKRFVTYLEDYVPLVDRKNVSESTLDYLDDLQGFLEAEGYTLWHFIKGSSYASVTDYWIAKVQTLYADFIAVVPLQEILNIFDAAVLNLNDRRAILILRSEIATSESDGSSTRVTNAKDVFKLIIETATRDIADLRDILLATAIEAKSETISEVIFLQYLNEILNPHDLSTSDLSTEMLAIISRTFARIKSIKRDSATDDNTKILTADLFRNSLQRMRDTIGILIPERNDSNHIELQSLLQLIVNKFGTFVSEQELKLVQFVNGVFGNIDERKQFEEDVSNFAQQLEIGFGSIPIKPSEFITEKLFELIEIIDVFVNSTSS